MTSEKSTIYHHQTLSIFITFTVINNYGKGAGVETVYHITYWKVL